MKLINRCLAVSFCLLFVLIFPTRAASGWYNGYRLSATINNNYQSSSHVITGENPGGKGKVAYTLNGYKYVDPVYGNGSSSTWTANTYIRGRHIYRAETTILKKGEAVYTITEVE